MALRRPALQAWPLWLLLHVAFSGEVKKQPHGQVWELFEGLGAQQVEVFYIRHGESIWNAERQFLHGTLTEEEIVRRGHEPVHNDSPLSIKGVVQARKLAENLFGAPGSPSPPARPGSASVPPQTTQLSQIVACAASGQCEAPLLLTSNLRRAIDTMVIGMRPLLVHNNDLRVVAVPTLQETATYADCTPLPLGMDGTVLFDPPHEVYAPDVASVLQQQHYALEQALNDSFEAVQLIGFMRNLYKHRLSVDLRQGSSYNERRRLADGTISNFGGRSVHALDETERRALLPSVAPFLERVRELLEVLMGTAGKTERRGAPVVIAGHSRFIRELLFLFSSKQALVSPDGTQRLSLQIGDGFSDACKDLSLEGTRLSNSGAVAFKLTLCRPPVCDSPALTIHDCRLDAGGKVLPRRPPPSSTPGTNLRKDAWRTAFADLSQIVVLVIVCGIALAGLLALSRWLQISELHIPPKAE